MMSNGSIISIPDSDTSLLTVLYDEVDEETSKPLDNLNSLHQKQNCELFVEHWTGGMTKDGDALHTAKKCYVEGLKAKSAETPTLIFEKSQESHKIESTLKLSKGSESRKEKAIDSKIDSNVIKSRRNTVVPHPENTKLGTIGRRKTVFIDTPNLPAKKSKKLDKLSKSADKSSPTSSTKTSHLVSSKLTDRPHKPKIKQLTSSSSENTVTGKSHPKNVEEKSKDKPPKKDYGKHSSYRDSNHGKSPFSQDRSSLLNQLVSVAQRSPQQSTSTSHRSLSHQLPSTHRSASSSHRHSSSSNRSASSSKHSDLRQQSTSSKITTTYHRSSHSKDNENAEKRSSEEKTHPDHQEKKIRTESNALIAMKDKVQIKEKSGASRDSKRVREMSKNPRSHKKPSKMEAPQLDPSMDPIVRVISLKIDSSSRDEMDKKKIILRDAKYVVYGVGGRIKIRKRKNRKSHSDDHHHHQRSDEQSRSLETQFQISDDSKDNTKDKTKDKVSDATNNTFHIETCDFSQQTECLVSTCDFACQKNDEEADSIAQKQKESIALFTQSVKEYDMAVCEQHKTIGSLQQMINEQKNRIIEREHKIAERERMISERDLKIAERERMIVERDSRITERDAKIAERDATIEKHASKVKEYEEKIMLQENQLHALRVEVDQLKLSEKSVTESLNVRTQESREKPTNNTTSTIRVKNIDQLRNTSFLNPTTSSQLSADATASPVSSNINQTPNYAEWTLGATTHDSSVQVQQPSCLNVTQYSETPVPVNYMFMYDGQQLQQSPGLQLQNPNTTVPASNASNAQAATPLAALTPHQRLPRIIQKAARLQPIQPQTLESRPTDGSFHPNSVIGKNDSTQLRNRSKTCYYVSRPTFQQLNSVGYRNVEQGGTQQQQFSHQSSNNAASSQR